MSAVKKIISLAIPMAGTNFINVASGFLCMAMIASLGHETLAASALMSATQLSIMVSGMSLLFSLSVLVGHAYGAQQYRDIGNYVQQAWTLAVLMGLPIMLFFWYIGPVLVFFGQTHQLATIVQSYFHAYIWAVIPCLLSTCNMQFGYGIHKKLLIITTSVMSVAVLLITAYTFILGHFGMPKLGVAGLGYALLAQYSFFFLFTTFFFYHEKSFAHFELFHYRVFQHLNLFAKMFKIGWPISAQMGGEMMSFFVNSILIGWLGTAALGAYQIVNQYYFLIVIPIFSISQASGILVSHACGSKQFQEVKNLSHASMGLAFAGSLIVAAIFLCFAKNLAGFFINAHDPANIATLHLVALIFCVIAFSQLFDSLRNVLIGILRGLFDTRFPMITGLFTIWIIGMPLSAFFAFALHFGVVGFTCGGLVGMMCGVGIMLLRWRKQVAILTKSS